jgi:hypothetical protein
MMMREEAVEQGNGGRSTEEGGATMPCSLHGTLSVSLSIPLAFASHLIVRM